MEYLPAVKHEPKHHSRDGLYVRLRELQEQQKGISPKLGLWATMDAEIKEIKKLLGDQTMSVGVGKHMLPVLQSSNGTVMRILKPESRCTHKRAERCNIKDCTNKPYNQGHCPSCGRSRYAQVCRHHKGKAK